MGAKQSKNDGSSERSCAEALMMACDERLGAQSPAALMVCDTFLARDFWMRFMHADMCASELWAWGSNAFSQLGVGDRDTPLFPVAERVFLAPGGGGENDDEETLAGLRFRAVVCGTGHTLVVSEDGALFAVGWNGQGQLGLESRMSSTRLRRVTGIPPVSTAVACSSTRTIACTEDGKAYAWGKLASECCCFRPISVSNLPEGKRVVCVACTDRCSFAVLAGGEVLAWGNNEQGLLGVNSDSGFVADPLPVQSLAGKSVRSVVCGANHTLALLREVGEVFAWGKNECGALGIGAVHGDKRAPVLISALSGMRVTAVSAWGTHNLALLDSGGVYSWGGNEDGQLGLGSRVKYVDVPRAIPFFSKRFQARSVHCGYRHCMAVLRNGDVYAWGSNSCGELGSGREDNEVHSTPEPVLATRGKPVKTVSIGAHASFALVA